MNSTHPFYTILIPMTSHAKIFILFVGHTDGLPLVVPSAALQQKTGQQEEKRPLTRELPTPIKDCKEKNKFNYHRNNEEYLCYRITN